MSITSEYLAAGGSSDTKHMRGQADTFEDLKIGAPSALTTKEIKLPSTEYLISLYLLVGQKGLLSNMCHMCNHLKLANYHHAGINM